MVYVAYNKMYKKGKAIGKKYVFATGKTKNEVTKKTNTFNASWNKLKANKSKGYKSKLVMVKKR